MEGMHRSMPNVAVSRELGLRLLKIDTPTRYHSGNSDLNFLPGWELNDFGQQAFLAGCVKR